MTARITTNEQALAQLCGEAAHMLRRFVLEHLDRIDIRKVDKFAFVALVANEAA